MTTSIALHKVPALMRPRRLSDYLFGIFVALPSKKSVKKAIKQGRVLVDGKRAYTGDWVQEGQEITLLEATNQPHKTFRLPLEVVYEDEYMAVVVKPAGYLVNGNSFQTIERALPFNLTHSTAPDAYAYPKAVHRLDRPTAGLLLIAKTAATHQHLGKQFEEKTIQKRYQALAIGEVPQQGSIEKPVEGKAAFTTYERVELVHSLKNGHLSLVNLYPQTGRTHQLRQHLASIGHPILGDELYGIEGLILKRKGLFLRALEVTFTHPQQQKKMTFSLPTPVKFTTLLAREQHRHDRYQATTQANPKKT